MDLMNLAGKTLNCHNKKVRDCHILNTVLLAILLLLITVSLCCDLIKYQARHLLPFHKY